MRAVPAIFRSKTWWLGLRHVATELEVVARSGIPYDQSKFGNQSPFEWNLGERFPVVSPQIFCPCVLTFVAPMAFIPIFTGFTKIPDMSSD